MIVALAFCKRDQDITLKLAEWIEELGGCKNHKLLLCHDHRVEENALAGIVERFEASFERVLTQKAAASIDGWPAGANYMFRLCCDRLKTAPFNEFMWLEPDAIPLKSGWLDSIEEEFKKCGKPFMGDRVDVNDVPLHMSGIGVYCNPIFKLAGEAYRAHDIAWDVAAAHQIVPQAHWTEQIVHNWKHEEFKNQSELDNLLTNNSECVLFHSDKSGSVIKLMRQKNLPASKCSAEHGHTGVSDITSGSLPDNPLNDCGNPRYQPADEARVVPLRAKGSSGGAETVRANTLGRSGGEIAAPISPVLADIWNRKGIDESRMPEGFTNKDAPYLTPTTDIFIRTYPKDYPWLEHCLKSIHKFCKGFRKIWIVSPQENPAAAFFDPKFIEWKVLNEETEDGYLSQQIHKLYADVITDYQPDYVLHIDSDTLFTRSVTPENFFCQIFNRDGENTENKLIWYYTPYEHTQTPWKPITEKFMGKPVKYEFMRRLPMVIPKWLYPKLREYCYLTHKDILSNYIKNQPNREFSEFNALGAFAYEKFRDKFEWVNTHEQPVPENCARQFQSWDGVTEEVKKEIDKILSGSATTDKAKAGTKNPDGMRVVDQASAAQKPLGSAVKSEQHSPANRGDVPGFVDAPTAQTSPNGSSNFVEELKNYAEAELGKDTPRNHINWLAAYADLPWKRQYVIKELKKKFKQKRKKREKLQAI